jgi:hypothetical protein
MFNAFDPKGAPEPTGRDRADRVPEQQPLADREVPIGFAVTPAGVHEWLDGDAAETDIRRADSARHIEFWNRLNAEAAVRREVRTPAHVQAQIMAAIAPQRATVVEPWFQRSFAVKPIVAIAAAAGLVAFGAAMAAMFAR